jgi:hypothetical protein
VTVAADIRVSTVALTQSVNDRQLTRPRERIKPKPTSRPPSR